MPCVRLTIVLSVHPSFEVTQVTHERRGRMIKRLLLVLGIVSASVLGVGCEPKSEGPADAVEDAAEEAGDSMEDTAEALKEAAEEAAQ